MEHTEEENDSEEIGKEVYDAVKKSDMKSFEEKCIHLLELYPDYVNTRVSIKGFTPFLRACWVGNITLVEYMLNNGADVSVRSHSGESAIYLAAYNAIKKLPEWNASLLNILHKSGCCVNTRHKHGFTALHLAAAHGHTKLVGWLLAHGADPFATTLCGIKPLTLARLQGHTDAVKLLEFRLHTDLR